MSRSQVQGVGGTSGHEGAWSPQPWAREPTTGAPTVPRPSLAETSSQPAAQVPRVRWTPDRPSVWAAPAMAMSGVQKAVSGWAGRARVSITDGAAVLSWQLDPGARRAVVSGA